MSNHDESHDGNGSFLIGLIAGAVLGAGLALIFAPRTGPEMRREVADRAQRLRDRAAEGYEVASERVTHLAERGKTAYRSAADRIRHDQDTASDESSLGSGPVPRADEPLT